MKTPPQKFSDTNRNLLLIILLTNAFISTGCSSLQNNINFNEPETHVDASFGKSVQRMLDIQKRPATREKMTAGNQLDGSEAERILSILNNNK